MLTLTHYCTFSYALADNVFRTMQSEFNNHFILISGESGAGKTEASKKILQFYAVSCPSTKLLNNVRDRLLLSNPVLEVSDMDDVVHSFCCVTPFLEESMILKSVFYFVSSRLSETPKP